MHRTTQTAQALVAESRPHGAQPVKLCKPITCYLPSADMVPGSSLRSASELIHRLRTAWPRYAAKRMLSSRVHVTSSSSTCLGQAAVAFLSLSLTTLHSHRSALTE